MSQRRLIVITIGVLLSLFMASVESTVVATAMPTIISQLGGLSFYSWVFSAYMLASTTTVPLYGKLSDLYGRRPVFMVAMVLFLLGSFLSGRSQSMQQLIGFRTLQGLGAGGLLPLAFIIIGDLFSFEQRARMQGLFSGVWGVSSIAGPLLGGYLVDRISWHWVFYVNIVPGLLALTLVAVAWRREPARQPGARVHVDYAGVGLLSAGVVLLLLGLNELGTLYAWILLAAAGGLLAMLFWVERRAPEPVLPLFLFRDRLFAVSCLHGVLAGWTVFGGASFVPLFAQGVLGTSATLAGSALTPQSLSWTLASILGARLLLTTGYRRVVLSGMVVLTAGSLLLARIGLGTSLIGLMASLALIGVGMGLSVPAFLIVVQNHVRRDVLGTATSTLQFSRSIGGTLGVSVMGAVLSHRLASGMLAAGLDPSALQGLTDPATGATSALQDDRLRAVLALGIRDVFVVALLVAVLALAATSLAPHLAPAATRRRATG